MSDVPSSLDEARIRYKVPINAAPRRQMRALVFCRALYIHAHHLAINLATELYRKVLTEISEREVVDLQGLTPEKIASLSRNKASHSCVCASNTFSRVVSDTKSPQASYSATESSRTVATPVCLCT